jgi:glycosyltransferase involved in cell wall biosynthesis
MATYNGATYLKEQLNSFLRQTRQIDELVVCDDGSTDDTLVLLEDFRHQAPFQVHIHHNEVNLGFTQNFNKALLKCSGSLIFLSDQDDVWFDNKVDVIERAFQANPGKFLAVHDGLIVDEALVWHGSTNFGQSLAGYGTLDVLVTGALTAVRSELLNHALPIPSGIVGHDGWLHNLARLVDARFVVDQKLQFIRRYSSNTSSWIASSIHEIRRLDVLLNQSITQPANNYLDRININESSSERLRQILNNNSIFSIHAIEDSLDNLILEHEAIAFRNILTNSSFLQRKIMAFQLLFKGQYRYFNGYSSFLRDILR